MPSILNESFSWRLWPVQDDGHLASDTVEFVYEDPAAPLRDRIISDVLHPRVFAYAPEAPNGRAALVLAGGGYTSLVIGKEGVEVAQWLCSLGFYSFVLVHRFPCARFTSAERSGSQAPLDDAIEAMRQIRARAAEFGIEPHGVGVCGLSSGGHLAASLVARYPSAWTPRSSTHAQIDSTPDFLIVGYAPISTNATGRTLLSDKAPLPPAEKQALYEALQPDVLLIDCPPPAFIVYAANDAVVPVQNAYRLQEALASKGRLAELHVFADAPHGFALRETHLPVGRWPDLCARWLAHQCNVNGEGHDERS